MLTKDLLDATYLLTLSEYARDERLSDEARLSYALEYIRVAENSPASPRIVRDLAKQKAELSLSDLDLLQ